MQIHAFWRTFSQKIKTFFNSCDITKYHTFLFQAVLHGVTLKQDNWGPGQDYDVTRTERVENGTTQRKQDEWKPYSLTRRTFTSE